MLADLLRGDKIEDLKENITFSRMHPSADSLFVYGTNKGTLKMCDMRLSSNADNSALSFKT